MKNLILQQIKKIKSQPIKIYQQQQEKVIDDNTQQKSTNSFKNTAFVIGVYSQSNDLFNDMIFCFPFIDIELSPKRIQMISKSIIQAKGKIVSFNGGIVSQQVDYLLVNPKIKIQIILKKINNKIQYKQILDFNFVLNSVREGVLLAISRYSLYKNFYQEEKDAEKTMTMAMKPHKSIKEKSFIRQFIEDIKQKNEENIKQYQFQHTPVYKKQIRLDQLTQDQQQSTISMKKREISSYKSTNQLILNFQQIRKPFINKDKFLCQKKITNFLCQKSITQENINQFSMNKFICEELMKLQKIYQSEKDIGRKIAYLKAVSAIKSLNYQIQSQQDVQNLKGIGKKIINKIKQLIRTGRLQKLYRLQNNEKNVISTMFCKIWGVGPNKAQQLYQVGVKNIQQLRTRTDLLNKNQRLGLKYFQDLLQKIPRQKMTKMFQYVKIIFKKHVDSIDNYKIQVCGSYRRGKMLCGDIDIIISRIDGRFQKKLLLDFILQLEKLDFLTDHLQFPSSADNSSSLSYMGICKYQDNIHHRIDIKYYPIEQYPYAILYFTGSDMFNRSMRLYAKKIGIHLSDHGAIARRDEKTNVIWEKPIPFCMNEEDIFKFLGLDYRTPKQRQV